MFQSNSVSLWTLPGGLGQEPKLAAKAQHKGDVNRLKVRHEVFRISLGNHEEQDDSEIYGTCIFITVCER